MTAQADQRQSEVLPFVSILIATRNRPADLVPCLETMLAQDYPDYEVVVLDQSSTDATERAVHDAYGPQARLRFLRSDSVGKSVALNLLLETAGGAILAFTDDDTVAPLDWLTRITTAFREDPAMDILFGQVLVATVGTPEEVLHTPSLYFSERRVLKRGEIMGMGANMAMRRETAALGVRFDGQLGPGTGIPAAEEGDFIYRLQRLGVRIALDPAVTLVHRATRTEKEWDRVLYGYGIGDAAFALKHLRCGDLSMVRKIAHGIGYIGARGCLRVWQRRPHSEFFYVRGYLNGIWRSLRMGVDKKTRLYRVRGGRLPGGTNRASENRAPVARPETPSQSNAQEATR